MTDISIIIVVIVLTLAAAFILIYRRKKTKLSVSAYITTDVVEQKSFRKGTIVSDSNGTIYEILLKLKITNNTDSYLEILSVFIEYEFEEDSTSEFEIIPNEFPIAIEQLDNCEISIQKEWLDYENVNSLGVIDSDGNRYSVSKQNLDKVWLESNNLPSAKNKYDKKQGPMDVTTDFVVVDRYRIKSTS